MGDPVRGACSRWVGFAVRVFSHLVLFQWLEGYFLDMAASGTDGAIERGTRWGWSLAGLVHHQETCDEDSTTHDFRSGCWRFHGGRDAIGHSLRRFRWR